MESPVENNAWIRDYIYNLCKDGNLVEVKKMLDAAKAPDLFQATLHGGTFLHATVIGGNSDLLKCLLSSWGSFCQDIALKQDVFGNTAMHLAIKRNRADLVKQLISFQPKLCYSTNKENESPLVEPPLFVAVRLGIEEMVKALVNAAPDCVQESFGNKNILHLAVELHQVHIVRFLTKHRCEVLKKIINQGAGLPLPDPENPLVVSILQGKEIPPVELGTWKTFGEYTISGDTPLRIALRKKCLQGQQSVSVEHRNESSEDKKDKGEGKGEDTMLGDTPLHIAARKKCLQMVNFLLHVPGVDKYAMNHSGFTALDIAKEKTEYFERYKIIAKLSDYPKGQRPFMYNAPSPTPQKLQNAAKLVDNIYNRRQNAELVVAALLATMTFTAVFQVPGGFQTENRDGGVIGTPTLIGSPSFKLFLIFDCVAFFLSLFVVYLWQMSSELTTGDKMLFMCINNLIVCLSFAFTAFGFIAAVYVILACKVKIFSWVVLGSMAYILVLGCVASWYKAATFSVTRARFNRLCGVLCVADDLVEVLWLKLEKSYILDHLRKWHEWIQEHFLFGLRRNGRGEKETAMHREGGYCSSSPLCRGSQHSA